MPYSITTKDGITIQNIPDNIQPDDPSIRQRVAKIRESGGAAAVDRQNKPPLSGIDRLPTEENVTLLDRLSNFGKSARAAIAAPLVGAAQRLGVNNAQGIADAWREDMAKMSNKPGGMGGMIVGGAATSAPLAMVPGANTVIGGSALGALTGALMPTEKGESPAGNIVSGAAAGGGIPLAINTAKGIRAAAIDPFTEAGRTRIAGGVLKRMAGDNVSETVRRLRDAKGATPGFTPSVAQAAQNDGLSAFERTMRGINPQAFQALDKQQKGALIDALLSVAKTPEERAAALKLADESAKNLYGSALKEQLPVTPELVKLAQRPSMRKAEARAQGLAAELSIPFQATLDDLRPKYIPIPGKQYQPANVFAEDAIERQIPIEAMPRNASVLEPRTSVDSYLGRSPTEIQIRLEDLPQRYATVLQDDVRQIPLEKGPSRYFELPPVESVPVRDMHTLKMGMDALMADPTLGIAGREARAINATRNRMLDLLPESYQKARLSHIEMNKPVHQMDIGRELYNRFVPALADQGGLPFKTSADNYARALLRNGDDLAKNVTGLKNATLEGVMEPQQMALLRGVAKDAESKAAAEMAGKGVGSDTVQKIAMSNIAAESGVPTWMSNIARVPGGWAKRAGDVLYGSADDEVRAKLAFLLTNPQEAAAAMESAGALPSKLAPLLRRTAQAGALSAPASYNALTAE